MWFYGSVAPADSAWRGSGLGGGGVFSATRSRRWSMMSSIGSIGSSVRRRCFEAVAEEAVAEEAWSRTNGPGSVDQRGVQ